MSLGPGNTCPSGGADYEVTITQADCQVYVDNSGLSWFNQTGTLQSSSPATLTISPNAIVAAAANTAACPASTINAGLWAIDVNFSFPGITPAIPTCNISATQAVVVGCTDDSPGLHNDVNGNAGGVPCPTPPCLGGYAAFNYNPNADVDDGSCTYPVYGCTDGGPTVGLMNPFVNPGYGAADNFDCATALNPNSTTPCNDTVTHDDGSCIYTGCMDASANNQCTFCNNANNTLCSYGTTGCINSAIGCHPAVTAIQDGVSIPGLGTCSPTSVAPNAVWNTTTLDCGTCRDGTTCGGNFCCGEDNGFDKTNFDPDASVACSGCCTSTNVSGCGQATMPSPNSGVATLNYNPCVDTNDNSVCIPTVYGCMDATALNYGSYASGSAWGAYSANTWFGATAPYGNTGTTWNYAGNPSLAATGTLPATYNGRVGPNMPGGPIGCGGINNPCDNCVYAVFGCMDDGSSATDPATGLAWQGRPSAWTGPAGNYDANAIINQVSQTNTTSPCCYTSGCILPDYFSVTAPSQHMNVDGNLSTQGCLDFINGVSGSTVNDCYGGMIDVSGITVAGTANGTNVGNGWQAGNNNIPVALNGGETCADHNCDTNTVGTSVHLLQNTDGYFDPGNIVPNPSNVSSLTTNWTNWPVGPSSFVSSGTSLYNPPGEDCCIYTDGCADPCATNFNPAATLQSAQACIYGTNAWCTVTAGGTQIPEPPWNDTHFCCDLGGSL